MVAWCAGTPVGAMPALRGSSGHGLGARAIVVHAYHVRHLSVSDIAWVTGISVPTVYKYVRRFAQTASNVSAFERGVGRTGVLPNVTECARPPWKRSHRQSKPETTVPGNHAGTVDRDWLLTLLWVTDHDHGATCVELAAIMTVIAQWAASAQLVRRYLHVMGYSWKRGWTVGRTLLTRGGVTVEGREGGTESPRGPRGGRGLLLVLVRLLPAEPGPADLGGRVLRRPPLHQPPLRLVQAVRARPCLIRATAGWAQPQARDLPADVRPRLARVPHGGRRLQGRRQLGPGRGCAQEGGGGNWVCPVRAHQARTTAATSSRGSASASWRASTAGRSRAPSLCGTAATRTSGSQLRTGLAQCAATPGGVRRSGTCWPRRASR